MESWFLVDAVRNTLVDGEQLPKASVSVTGSVVITMHKTAENAIDVEKLGEELQQLEDTVGINKVLPHEPLVTMRSLSDNKLQVEINISAKDFHELLLKHSEIYAGYRHGVTYAMLEDHYANPCKADRLCLFPMQDIGDGQYIIRNAGCNISETVSTQLAFIAEKNIQTRKPIARFFGHHESPFTNKYVVKQPLLMRVLSKFIGNEIPNHQQSDGDTVITLSGDNANFVSCIDEVAGRIYGQFSACPVDEYPHLVSLEIPLDKFLVELLEASQSDRETHIAKLLEIGGSQEQHASYARQLYTHQGDISAIEKIVAELKKEITQLSEERYELWEISDGARNKVTRVFEQRYGCDYDTWDEKVTQEYSREIDKLIKASGKGCDESTIRAKIESVEQESEKLMSVYNVGKDLIRIHQRLGNISKMLSDTPAEAGSSSKLGM